MSITLIPNTPYYDMPVDKCIYQLKINNLCNIPVY